MKNITKIYVHKQRLTKIFSSKRQRGLATVVSAAILLSAISIMGVMLVAWTNTNLYSKQIQQESAFNAKINKLNENLLIENIWFGPYKNSVNVTLSNVGSVGLNVTNIEIVNSTGVVYLTIIDGGIAPLEVYSLNRTFYWTSGETTNFQIITERGNIFTAQEVT